MYNNDSNIILRYYKIDIYSLYKYKIFQDLTAITYNKFLTVSLSACKTNQCDNKDNSPFFTTLLIFSYINATDYNINITTYFSDKENKDSDDILLNFPNNFKIDNNIFGYQIKQKIRISSIPDEINLYIINNDNTKKQINIGDEYMQNINLMINPKNNIIKNYTTYFIEYQYQYSEPDYDTFNKYANKIYNYPENSTVSQKEEFNNDIQTYYGRSIRIKFNLCNENCKTCKSIGKSSDKTKCEECKDNLKFYFDKNTGSNTCFLPEKECPVYSPFLSLKNNFKCEDSCDFEDIKNNNCILDNSSEESLKKVHNMFSDLISNQYNNEDIVFKTENDLAFQLSNSLNEKENLKKGGNPYNLSIIDLAECETKLKSIHSISQEIPLIILKTETFYENTTIKNIQYEIYNPITKKKIKDLSPCDNSKINIYVPTNIDNETFKVYEDLKNQGFDLFNSNDSFYNDLCTKYTSINKTDVTLNDRKQLFYDNNQIFCQEDCEYNGIDLETKYAKCECPAITKEEIIFKKQQFSGMEIIVSFYEVIKFSNFLVLKCYKFAFSSIGLKNNYGFIIMIILISFLLLMLIVFIFSGMNKIKEQMSQMIFSSINKKNKEHSSQKELKYNNLKKLIFLSNPKKKNSKKKEKKNKKELISKIIKIKTKSRHLKKKFKLNIISDDMRKNTSSWGLKRKKSNINFLKKKKSKNSSHLSEIQKLKLKNGAQKYSEFELDDLEYLEAIKYDKRTFLDFFFCLVKREHIIVFTFIYCKDLNLLCIKLSLFVFSISLDFATNVLFFTDDSMHKIFLDYGKYNFIQQIPQIIYSTIISETFDVLLKFLSLSEKEIYQTKKFTSITTSANEVKKLIRRLKIKFFLFYLICFLLMLFFCYFISCFCAVYENTQIVLFKDSFFSLLISFIYPFGLYIIPASLRIISLRSKKKDQKFLYKISNIFPLF